MDLQKNFTWNVKEIPSVIRLKGKYQENGTKTLVRSDNDVMLSVVGKDYGTAQPKWFADQVASLGAIIQTPLTGFQEFDEGRKIAAYLKTDRKKICGFPMQEFLVICTGYDNQATFLGTSSKLLRCDNEFGSILKQAKVRHTKNHRANVESLFRDYKEYALLRDQFYESFEGFRKIKIKKDIPEKLVNHLLDIDPEQKISTRKRNIKELVLESVHTEIEDLGWNAFGLFNGVTHYTTHVLNPRKENILGNFFGQQNVLNQKAFNYCQTLIN